MQTLKQAEPFSDQFVAVGLASAEVGNPPENFKELYAQAREQGYKAVAHAGEEGPPQFVWDSLNLLNVQRIDHGVRSLEDADLIKRLSEEKVPLTVCPLSNVRLCVFEKMADHNILELLDQGICATVNSDDPAYFGGYINENFLALENELGMTKNQAVQLARNSFTASFLSPSKSAEMIAKLDQYLAT